MTDRSSWFKHELLTMAKYNHQIMLRIIVALVILVSFCVLIVLSNNDSQHLRNTRDK